MIARRRQWPRSQTRPLVVSSFDSVHDDSNRLIAAPYYLRLFQPDCHVALQMFSNATTVHVLRRPVISRSSLLVARSADRDSSLADPCALLFSYSFSFSFSFVTIRGPFPPHVFVTFDRSDWIKEKFYSSQLNTRQGRRNFK